MPIILLFPNNLPKTNDLMMMILLLKWLILHNLSVHMAMFVLTISRWRYEINSPNFFSYIFSNSSVDNFLLTLVNI